MRLAPLLSYGAVFWVAALVGAPLLVTSGSASAALAGVIVYRAASVVCHQVPTRSFELAGLPLAVCARCFGLYAGAAAAVVAAMLVGSRTRISSGLQSGFRMLLAASAMPTAISWTFERVGLWAGSNIVRFAAALPLGLTAAWIVLATVRAETADTID